MRKPYPGHLSCYAHERPHGLWSIEYKRYNQIMEHLQQPGNRDGSKRKKEEIKIAKKKKLLRADHGAKNDQETHFVYTAIRNNDTARKLLAIVVIVVS
jgi:hypothetical protein